MPKLAQELNAALHNGKRSALEDLLEWQLKAAQIGFVREYRFHPKRKWRADFKLLYGPILIECEGSTWANGRHNRGSGFEADTEKYNTAATLGYAVLRVTRKQIVSGQALKWIEEMVR